MAINDKNLITCVELGTHSIRALHGTRDHAGNPVVLGVGQASAENSVCKGEIVKSTQAGAALEKALQEADKSAGVVSERRNVYCIVNGAGVTSRQGEGQVLIYDDDHKVKRNHIIESVTKAQNISLPPDQVFLSSFDSYFMLDSQTCVQNPEGESARQLDAFLHIISARTQQLEIQRNVLREIGFEDQVTFVPSCVASVYGCMEEEEKHTGALLIDLGAGVTNYIMVKNDGIMASGVLPVGMENIANDLSVGLDLPIEYCRKLLLDKTFFANCQNGTPYIEVGGPISGTKRKIPIGSFERIITLRLTETFTILRERLDPQTCVPRAESGIILCGGGALFPEVKRSLNEVLKMPVRIGTPTGVSGAMTDLEPAVRYTTILGLLKYVIDVEGDNALAVSKFGDALENFSEVLVKKFKNLTEVFKI